MKKLLLCSAAIVLCASASFAADLASDANYKAKCAMCHGASGEGKPAMKIAPLKDSAAKPEADLVGVIAKGKAPKMPAYDGKLKPEEIKALAAEIKALK